MNIIVPLNFKNEHIRMVKSGMLCVIDIFSNILQFPKLSFSEAVVCVSE